MPVRAKETAIAWKITDHPVPYPDAVAFMESRVAEIRDGTGPETVWLLEHPPLYTAGTSARDDELLDPGRFPVFRTGRGGRFTYHGPGQRIGYVMLDLAARGGDVHAFVGALEEWLIRALACFNVKGERKQGRVGIWVDLGPHGGRRGQEAKIAALGVRVRRGVTFHGVALNVDPDLGHFAGIVPCGLADSKVTSLLDLGITAAAADVDMALMETFGPAFAALPRLPGNVRA